MTARGGLNNLLFGAMLTDEEAAALPAMTLAYLVEIEALEVVT